MDRVGNGEVYTWGCEDDGKLGHGTATNLLATSTNTKIMPTSLANKATSNNNAKIDFNVPNRIDSLYQKGIRVTQIGCGLFHSAAIGVSTSGEGRHVDVYCWGLGLGGRLGFGHEKSVEVPTLVSGIHFNLNK